MDSKLTTERFKITSVDLKAEMVNMCVNVPGIALLQGTQPAVSLGIV